MVLPELCSYLEAQGIGTRGTDLFYSLLPPTPAACVVLYEYGGPPNEPVMGGTTVRAEYPRVQIIARGAAEDDYDTPRLKMQNIVIALTKIREQSILGVQYQAVMALQVPFPLERDESHRIIMACNFQVTKDYSST